MMDSTPNRPPPPGQLLPVRCHVCGSSDSRVLPFRYAFAGRFLYGMKCPSCSLVFVHPQPSGAEIAELYREEYFTEHSDTCGAHGPAAYMEMARESEAERKKGARRLDERIGRYRSGRGRLLEIGCGPGFFLAAMRDLGWSVTGLEISEFAVRHAVAELGLDVVHGSIEEGRFADGSFDSIFLGDVLEHLPAPLGSLRILRGWLKPGGVVVVAVPSTMNLVSAKLGMMLYRMRGTYKTLRIPPYHLFEYDPTSLRRTLAASELRVLDLRESAVPLGKMGLRGTLVENAGKVSLQVLAHFTSRLFNRGGDRLVAIARRG